MSTCMKLFGTEVTEQLTQTSRHWLRNRHGTLSNRTYALLLARLPFAGYGRSLLEFLCGNENTFLQEIAIFKQQINLTRHGPRPQYF
jgi:hypothetical protein